MGEMCDFLSSGVDVTLLWLMLEVVSADLQAVSMSPFLFFFWRMQLQDRFGLKSVLLLLVLPSPRCGKIGNH